MLRWGPVAAYILLILAVSSVPHLTTPGFNGSDKIAHLGEYSILGFLVSRALGARGAGRWIAAIAIAAVVGACDETYQLTVPGRFSSRFDWMADVAGGIAGAAAWIVLARVRARRAARAGS